METEREPWYVDLLGQRPTGAKFKQFSKEFNLEPWDGVNSWIEAPEGISLRIRHDKIFAIMFFVEPQHGYTGCNNNLPYGLKKNMLRLEIWGKLGHPDKSEDTEVSALARVHIDRYRAGPFQLIVETSMKNATLQVIRLETISNQRTNTTPL